MMRVPRPPQRPSGKPRDEDVSRDGALWFLVVSFALEFGGFIALVALVDANYYAAPDPEFVGATWPIISFGLASSRDIQTYYLVVTSLALAATLAWFALLDGPAKHRGRGCGPLLLWAARALLHTAQMALLVALGGVSVLQHETAHNAIGAAAGGCYLLHEALTVPYQFVGFLKAAAWRPSVLCRRGVSLEAAVGFRALLAALFCVSLFCFWEIACSPVATDSWWEYAMYGVFPLQRLLRLLDVALWPPAAPTCGCGCRGRHNPI